MLRVDEDEILAWLNEIMAKPRASLIPYDKEVLEFIYLFNELSTEWHNDDKRVKLQGDVDEKAQRFFKDTYADQDYKDEDERIDYRRYLLAIMFRGIFLSRQIIMIDEEYEKMKEAERLQDLEDSKDTPEETSKESDESTSLSK